MTIDGENELFSAAWLRNDVKVEPLVDRWYAWPHLLAPLQQGLNLARRYIPMLESFVAAPAVHEAANSDPEMFGGPFVDLSPLMIPEVKDYIHSTARVRAPMLKMADDLIEFDRRIQAAAGYSLDEFREQIPESLSGLVDICYDLNNHPKLHILEEIINFDSMAFGAKQELLLHSELDVARPFFLSTPRLASALGTYIETPFNSELSRILYGARDKPVDLVDVSRRINLPLESLKKYFQCTRPEVCSPAFLGDGVRVRYFGHACVLIESRQFAILIDPTFTQDSSSDGRYTMFDLPDRIDLLVLSHGHQDHFCPEALLGIRSRVHQVLIPCDSNGELADPSLHLMLKGLGFLEIKTMRSLEQIIVPGGRIISLPFSGEHCDLNISSRQCVLVELENRKVALFVDSDAIDISVYRRLLPILQDIDLVLLGMECFGAPLSWMYGPLLSQTYSKRIDNSRRLSGANRNRACALTAMLMPKMVWVYAMGQEPWMRYLMGLNYKEDSIQLTESTAFVSWCRSNGIEADRLYISRQVEL